MSSVLQVACVGLALLSALAVLGSARDVRLATRVLLDLLLGAGLLRLAGAADWRDVAGVGLLVLVRLLVR